MNKLIVGGGIYEKGRHEAWDAKSKRNTKEYETWYGFLKRCSAAIQATGKFKSYVGCSVHPDFIKFQDFAEWCQHQIGFGNDGWALDKDILVRGNKVYGPDTCVFVPSELNSLLTHVQSTKGDLPTGVSIKPIRVPKYKTDYDKTPVYKAQIMISGAVTFLGYFDTPEAAEAVYKVAKTKEIRRRAELVKDQIDPRAYNALMNYVV